MLDMTIGGRPVVAAERFKVLDPATGEVAGLAPNGTPADLDLAVEAATRAARDWSRQSNEELRAACQAVAGKISAHSEELAQLLTREQGKPLNGLGSRWELGGAVAWADYTAGLEARTKILQDDARGRVELRRRPIGVVGSITPWNFPVMIAVWHILPALRTGNTVVIKPSPLTPLSTLRLVELMSEVLPEGVVNCVTAEDRGSGIGAAMAGHKGIGKIVFTGSCETGQSIMATAAPTVKRLTLEMGGNDAGIVLPDVDPKAIAEGLFWGAFINNGQTCAALKRLYVHADVHDAVCDVLVEVAKSVKVGNGLDETVQLGPIQNRAQADKVAALVESAKARGHVLVGGEAGDGLFYGPTIVAGLDNGDPLVDEEQFGPALPVIRVSSVEEAIAKANASSFGLGGSVWSGDLEAARAIAPRIECGTVWVNKHGALQPNAPFGGIKSSGLGVEFAEDGLAEYTDLQVLIS